MDRRRLLSRVITAYRVLNVLLEWLALTLLVVMTLVTIYRVTTRFFFSFTPSWTEELSCILMIWLAMIGLAIGIRERMHLAILLFYDKSPRWMKRGIDWLLVALQLCVGIYLTLAGLRLTIDQFPTTMSAVKLFPFSDRMMTNSIMYVFVPIAGLLIIVYTAIHVLDKKGLFRLRTLETQDLLFRGSEQ